MTDHRLIDERSLAFDRLTAAKLAADPSLLERARANVQRWLATCPAGVRPALLEWQTILAGPVEAVQALLAATDEHAVQLRQSSPFAGALTPAERTAIILAYKERESNPA